jgi:hypothetical protein
VLSHSWQPAACCSTNEMKSKQDKEETGKTIMMQSAFLITAVCADTLC